MPNLSRSARAVCPFFKRSVDEQIQCESAMRCVTLHRFRSVQRAEDHLRRYCNTYDWQRCPYARLLILYNRGEI